eukprot:3940803-Rhodomonas_salina.2
MSGTNVARKVLGPRYAVSGTELAFGAICVLNAMRCPIVYGAMRCTGTEAAYGAMRCNGTEIAYRAMRCTGTETAYGAMRCTGTEIAYGRSRSISCMSFG